MEDGAYCLRRGREEALWPTAHVLLVQAALGYPVNEMRKTATGLLTFKGRVPDDPEAAELVDIDCQLQGWPWALGNFSWAEPTAWACLALRRAGFGHHARVEEGLRLLLDRAADEGGINYGNRRILGRLTEPLVEPTAYMLLALQGHGAHPRVQAAIHYLLQQVQEGQDLEINWARPAPVREALTALALATDQTNYFRLAGAEGQEQPCPEVKPLPKKRAFPDRIKSLVRGLIIEGAGRLKQPASQTKVHIATASDYQTDLAAILHQQYASFRDLAPVTGKRVVIKPNLVEYHPNKVINTHPHVVAATIELCKRELSPRDQGIAGMSNISSRQVV
jgi:hypothetical protein